MDGDENQGREPGTRIDFGDGNRDENQVPGTGTGDGDENRDGDGPGDISQIANPGMESRE